MAAVRAVREALDGGMGPKGTDLRYKQTPATSESSQRLALCILLRLSNPSRGGNPRLQGNPQHGSDTALHSPNFVLTTGAAADEADRVGTSLPGGGAGRTAWLAGCLHARRRAGRRAAELAARSSPVPTPLARLERPAAQRSQRSSRRAAAIRT